MQTRKIEIMQTHDGSPTLFIPEINERYHSLYGAISESEHVYIQSGLKAFNARFPSNSIHILEIGFGTGLNAILALKWANSTQKAIQYTSLEVFPILKDIWSQLHYSTKTDEQLKYAAMHEAEWEKEIEIDAHFKLQKREIAIQDLVETEQQYNVVFFDAFAPNKQAEMWEEDIFKTIFETLQTPACLVTYCVRGYIRRNMRAAGFKVERIQGPPGKRQMIRAWKLNSE